MTSTPRPVPSEPTLERTAQDLGGRFYGVYPAVVTAVRNPDGSQAAQIQIALPWPAGGTDLKLWARYAAMMAGPCRGAWFIPEVGDEVLVAFEGGNVDRPYVLGGLWNGKDLPPETVSERGTASVRSITGRSGARIALEETEVETSVSIETPEGRTVRLTDGARGGRIVVEDGEGNRVEMADGQVTVRSAARVEVEAATVKVSAAVVNLDTPVVQASGVVTCETLVTDTVVASTYTPGAGNIW